ncbi:MAG: TolC family protein [Syntrophaceae bacterium]|nr:TolC family protein [Syntrophaceae bacterium]
MNEATKNKNVRHFILTGLISMLFVLAFLGSPVQASETVPSLRILTLDDVQSVALDKNKDIQKALEYRRYVEGRYVAERAAALPQLTAHLGATKSRDESQKGLMGGIVPIETKIQSAEVSLSQALFTWGQVGSAIRAAKVGMANAEDQLRIIREATLRDVTAAFYNILLAREFNRIAVQNLGQKNRHLKEMTRKFQAGVATDYDVLSWEVAVENARPEVIRTENLIRTTLDQLRFLLGMDEGQIDVTGTLDTMEEPYPEYEATLQVARARRPELSEIRNRTRMAEEVVNIANANNKPRLDLRADYGYKDWEQDNADSDGDLWTAGLYITFPFFDGLRTQGQVTQAKSEVASLKIEESKLQDAIALQVRDAINAVRESGEILKALASTVNQANRLLLMAEKGYEYGVKTKLDVDDAQFNLNSAKANLAKARRDYLTAQVNLDWVKGTLVQ